ncbi:MAG: 3-deoxy-D-manno-octulosonic acid transferase [Planctomycetes bacterium]|nr:3-deoxy-D-manno-octulosonic acid transferase [Planctomycetota bacterium]
MNSSPQDPGPPSAAGCAGASRGWDLLYGFILTLGFPVFLYRRYVLKKDVEGRAEKRGYVRERAPHPRRIWIHAVSVGETVATKVLVERLRKEIPDAEIVFSTTTQTGQEVARKLYGEANVFYYPRDLSGAVKRSFDRVKHALIVLLELEVWPNFTAEALARGVPVVVVNGRITERSAGRYARVKSLLGPSFRRVRRWLMQTEEYAQRIKGLGVEPARVEIAGNIKYDDVETATLAPEERAAARAMLGLPEDAAVLIGGSTHPSEEETLLDAYKTLRERLSNLRLVLVPRHPHRLDEVQKAIAARGFPVVRRSVIKERGSAAFDVLPADDRTRAVILVDTMGELKKMYKAADAAFVGGSLIPHGGQNPMEPAGFGIPTLYGPHMHNFSEAVEILREANGGVTIENAAALAPALEKLLADPTASTAMGARAREALLKRQGATARCVRYIKSLL